MISKESLIKIRSISHQLGYSIIREVGVFRGLPVIQFSKEGLSGKFGSPVLYVVDGEDVGELDYDYIWDIVSQPLFQSGGKLL